MPVRTQQQLSRIIRQYLKRALPILRDDARAYGYAIAVHGSLKRDIDLIAIPWTTEAISPFQLAKTLRARILELDEEVLQAFTTPKHFAELLKIGADPAAYKPHGRLCWSFWLRCGTYIDLSVMPPLTGHKRALIPPLAICS